MMRKIKYKEREIIIAIILLNAIIAIFAVIITRSMLLPAGLITEALLLSVLLGLYASADRLSRTRVLSIFEKKEDKYSVKDSFIANAYHELRASYSSIFAIINVLYKTETKAEMERVIGNLKATFQVSKSTMDNILEFEKYQAGINSTVYSDEVSMRSLVSDLVEICQYAADEKAITLTAVIPEDFPENIRTDKTKINQILVNLLSNAIKFGRNNTIVFIHVDLEGYDNWQLCVEDQGEGIPDDLRDRIFEAFETSNPGGIGLGLYIVRQLARSLEGKASVTSDPGQVTKFTITLPLRPSRPRGAGPIKP